MSTVLNILKSEFLKIAISSSVMPNFSSSAKDCNTSLPNYRSYLFGCCGSGFEYILCVIDYPSCVLFLHLLV